MWVNTGECGPISRPAGNIIPCSRVSSYTDESPCYREKQDDIVPAQCSVVTLGTGDTGQLGLGPEVLETVMPTVVPRLSNVVQVAVGGMHTVCLDIHGKVRFNGAVLQILDHG